MPGRDRTGPMGKGPMTGRAAGLCADIENTGDAGPGGRRGLRRGGRGQGRGRRNRNHATGMTGGQSRPGEQELEALKREAAYLRHAFEEITGRIQALEDREAEEAE